jgi:hypothetical protein
LLYGFTTCKGKILKHFGITQDSLFCQIGDDNPDPKYNVAYRLYSTTDAYHQVGMSWYEHRIAVFTSSELGMMLGSEMYTWCDGVYWHCTSSPDNPFHLIDQTEARVKAAELISLLRLNCLSAELVNNRLFTASKQLI